MIERVRELLDFARGEGYRSDDVVGLIDARHGERVMTLLADPAKRAETDRPGSLIDSEGWMLKGRDPDRNEPASLSSPTVGARPLWCRVGSMPLGEEDMAIATERDGDA
jgi:hypothetical protein